MNFADGSYAGEFEECVRNMGQIFGRGASIGPDIINKLDGQKGFIVLPSS